VLLYKLRIIGSQSAGGGIAVAVCELGQGADYDISAEIKRSEQSAGHEGVVDDQKRVVLVSDLGKSLDVRNSDNRVGNGLTVDHDSVRSHSCLDSVKIADVNKGILYAVLAYDLGEDLKGLAVQSVAGNDMVAGLGVGNDCCADSSHTGVVGAGCLTVLNVGHQIVQSGTVRVTISVVAETALIVSLLKIVQVVHVVSGGQMDRKCLRVGSGLSEVSACLKNVGCKIERVIEFADHSYLHNKLNNVL
jgi:hypothetical protein